MQIKITNMNVCRWRKYHTTIVSRIRYSLFLLLLYVISFKTYIYISYFNLHNNLLYFHISNLLLWVSYLRSLSFMKLCIMIVKVLLLLNFIIINLFLFADSNNDGVIEKQDFDLLLQVQIPYFDVNKKSSYT